MCFSVSPNVYAKVTTFCDTENYNIWRYGIQLTFFYKETCAPKLKNVGAQKYI